MCLLVVDVACVCNFVCYCCCLRLSVLSLELLDYCVVVWWIARFVCLIALFVCFDLGICGLLVVRLFEFDFALLSC